MADREVAEHGSTWAGYPSLKLTIISKGYLYNSSTSAGNTHVLIHYA